MSRILQTSIKTAAAPAAIGPYSQAIRCPWPGDPATAHHLVFLSGQIGLEPGNPKLVGGGIEAQTRQIFKNVAAILQAAGGSLDQAVKVTVFLRDLSHFPAVNAIYAKHFSEPYPARSTVVVKDLPLGAEIEIEVTALIPAT